MIRCLACRVVNGVYLPAIERSLGKCCRLRCKAVRRYRDFVVIVVRRGTELDLLILHFVQRGRACAVIKIESELRRKVPAEPIEVLGGLVSHTSSKETRLLGTSDRVQQLETVACVGLGRTCRASVKGSCGCADGRSDRIDLAVGEC